MAVKTSRRRLAPAKAKNTTNTGSSTSSRTLNTPDPWMLAIVKPITMLDSKAEKPTISLTSPARSATPISSTSISCLSLTNLSISTSINPNMAPKITDPPTLNKGAVNISSLRPFISTTATAIVKRVIQAASSRPTTAKSALVSVPRALYSLTTATGEAGAVAEAIAPSRSDTGKDMPRANFMIIKTTMKAPKT